MAIVAQEADDAKQLDGLDNAAASEIAASAAQLRLLMQKLISTRVQAPHQQRPVSASSVSGKNSQQQLTTEDSAPIRQDNAQASQAEQVSTSTPTTNPQQQQVTAETPGMANLAAQARDLLREIEAAAAGSPYASQPGSPQLQQARQAAAAQRKLPFAAQQQHQSRLGQLPELAGYAAGTAANAAAGISAGCGMSLADSNTWSVALQQYERHQHNTAALLAQQDRIVDSCGSTSRTAPAAAIAEDSCNAEALHSAAMSAERLTPATYMFNSTEAAGLLQDPTAAAATAAAAVAARLTAATTTDSSCIPLQPSATAAAAATDRYSCLQQQQQELHTESARSGNTGIRNHSRLSPDGVRLKVKALRGPLEDAMRCFSELQEAREEVSLLRARNSRLTTAAEAWEAERGYLLAERKLQVAQLRQLAVLLAADTGAVKSASVASLEAAQQDVQDAEQQLETHWRLLPTDSSLRIMAGPSQLAKDLAAVTAEVESAVGRRQQQIDMLTGELTGSRTELLQQQQRAEALQQQLVGVRQAADVNLQQEIAAVEAKGEKKLLRAEQKLLKLAQIHQSAVAEFQRQLQQHQEQLTSAQQQQERLQEERQALQQRMEQLEEQREELRGELLSEREAKTAAEDKVATLQREHRQLMSAVSALEESLAAAQSAVQEQEVLRQRLEESVQAKSLTIMETKQELRDTRLAAQNAQAEVQLLQEQLGALKSKAADTARQLSAARTAVHEAQQELSAEQQRVQHQAAVMDDLRAELDRARKATAAAQKAQAAEAKRAAAAESATAATAQAELSAAQTAAAAAHAAATAAKKECKQLQQEQTALLQRCKSLEQQVQDRKAEQQELVAHYEQQFRVLQHRAEAAEADLLGIRQEVADWVFIRSREHTELQETRAKLQETSTDLGVALQKVAAVGMQARLSGSNTSRPQAMYGRPGSASNSSNRLAGSSATGLSDNIRGPCSPARAVASSGLPGHQQQHQQLPPEVARQLQWQANEVVRLQAQLRQLQEQLQDANKQLGNSQVELQETKQRLAAAEDTIAWQKRELQGKQPGTADGHLQQQKQRLQQLEVALSEADGRVAELTSQLSAARAELVVQQRQYAAQIRELQDQLAAAESAEAEAQQRVQQLQSQLKQRRQQLQQPSTGWADSGPLTQEWQGQRQSRTTAAIRPSNLGGRSLQRTASSSSSDGSCSVGNATQNQRELSGPAAAEVKRPAGKHQSVRQRPGTYPGSNAGQPATAASAADQLAHAAEAFAALVAGNSRQAAGHVDAAECNAASAAAEDSSCGYGTVGAGQQVSPAAATYTDLEAESSIGSSCGTLGTRRKARVRSGKQASAEAAMVLAATSTTRASARHGKSKHVPKPSRNNLRVSSCLNGKAPNPSSSSSKHAHAALQRAGSKHSNLPPLALQASAEVAQEQYSEGDWRILAGAEDSSQHWEVATMSSVDYNGAIAAGDAALGAAAAAVRSS